MPKGQKRIPNSAITWDRVRAIFGNAKPPREVWESQFDYGDDDLKRLAATPYREINREDLWYYFHDLAYVELQPDLFDYLFPVCLMEWHDSLVRGAACSRGDSEFHKGMVTGQVFEKMLAPEQQESVRAFFRDSFLQRLDAEQVFMPLEPLKNPFAWICRFNSLGMILDIGSLWDAWWRAETRGRAIAVLKYCSGLIYFQGDNEPFGYPSGHRPGKFGPQLSQNDSFIHEGGWREANVRFLRETLSAKYVFEEINRAAFRLEHEPERELAQRIVRDAASHHEIVESRVVELPELLARGEQSLLDSWTV